MDRPTGIIRTLPTIYADSEHLAMQRMERSIDRMMRGLKETIHIFLDQKPTLDVLYLYILVNGTIRYRFKIVEYMPGDRAVSWDGQKRSPKWMAVVTDPVKPPHEIKMRGFQGFRYTEELW
jgi:hypothetical protein